MEEAAGVGEEEGRGKVLSHWGYVGDLREPGRLG